MTDDDKDDKRPASSLPKVRQRAGGGGGDDTTGTFLLSTGPSFKLTSPGWPDMFKGGPEHIYLKLWTYQISPSPTPSLPTLQPFFPFEKCVLSACVSMYHLSAILMKAGRGC